MCLDIVTAIIKLDFKNVPVVNRSHMQNYEMI